MRNYVQLSPKQVYSLQRELNRPSPPTPAEKKIQEGTAPTKVYPFIKLYTFIKVTSPIRVASLLKFKAY